MFEQPSTRAKPIGRECWAQSTRPPLDLLDYFRSENARHAREAYVTREGKGTSTPSPILHAASHASLDFGSGGDRASKYNGIDRQPVMLHREQF